MACFSDPCLLFAFAVFFQIALTSFQFSFVVETNGCDADLPIPLKGTRGYLPVPTSPSGA